MESGMSMQSLGVKTFSLNYHIQLPCVQLKNNIIQVKFETLLLTNILI